jgi:predicted dehydrogenase
MLEVPVEVDTHATAVMEFSSGVVGTFIGSFDVWGNRLPPIEIYGSNGTLSLPHPNWYDGPVSIRLHDDSDWEEIEPVFAPVQIEPSEKVRGLGLVDLVEASHGHPHRTNATLAYHVLEVLEAMAVSSDQKARVEILSRTERPDPLRHEDLERWRR